MQSVFYVAAIVLMVAVAVVLVRGLWNLMRGGSANTSNKLMQMRIFLQLIAIICIVGFILLSRAGH